ncbi:hypothetical protein QR680_005563 [Steinernema hermaphroditum]|uniref:Fucosyltransferase n=1 Tax=Steinernema hermaphroditum TaxID=289476 RepID=A0AA39HUQ8_9BILA|nr:hypothetical protein QR680_005563 [Steinernema hermaphroditum]
MTKRKFFVFLLLLLSVYVCLIRLSAPSNQNEPSRIPLITIHRSSEASRGYLERSFYPQFNVSFERCNWKCAISFDQQTISSSSAVVFEARQADHVPDRAAADQIFVFFSLESPMFPGVRRKLRNLPKAFFNRTMTYRSDSDYHVPYDRFEESGELYAPSFVEEAVSRKDVDVLMVVSKCHTPGKRELMIEEFRKLIDVRFLGACAKRNCDEHCLHESVMKARFYLSLENSVCPEYVTEKVFRMKELIVPLVFRKEDHEALLPKNSFIAIDQFRTWLSTSVTSLRTSRPTASTSSGRDGSASGRTTTNPEHSAISPVLAHKRTANFILRSGSMSIQTHFAPVLRLPDDIWTVVLESLHFEDIVSLGRTSSALYGVLTTCRPIHYINLCLQNHGDLVNVRVTMKTNDEPLTMSPEMFLSKLRALRIASLQIRTLRLEASKCGLLKSILFANEIGKSHFRYTEKVEISGGSVQEEEEESLRLFFSNFQRGKAKLILRKTRRLFELPSFRFVDWVKSGRLEFYDGEISSSFFDNSALLGQSVFGGRYEEKTTLRLHCSDDFQEETLKGVDRLIEKWRRSPDAHIGSISIDFSSSIERSLRRGRWRSLKALAEGKSERQMVFRNEQNRIIALLLTVGRERIAIATTFVYGKLEVPPGTHTLTALKTVFLRVKIWRKSRNNEATQCSEDFVLEQSDKIRFEGQRTEDDITCRTYVHFVVLNEETRKHFDWSKLFRYAIDKEYQGAETIALKRRST